MNLKSRSYNSVLNISVSLFSQIVILIFSFVNRSVFIKLLGTEFLGMNGLYTNILSVLSLADLGIGSAMIYSLYRPIQEDNKEKIAVLIHFYKKIYIKIAFVVFLIGIFLLPFMNFFINTERPIENQELYFLLFLLNSVVSYLFAYKRAIITADQKLYLIKFYDLFINISKNILQIFVLIYLESYIAFLLIHLLATIFDNYLISSRADREYPFIKKENGKLSVDEKNVIFANVKSMFLYRIGGVILNSTDNILISIIVGTIWVGYYSNYFLIVGTVTMMANLIFSAISSSVGNLNSTHSKDDNSYQVFNALNFMNFWIFGFSSIALFSLLSDFITLWIGKEFLLNELTVLAIVLNVYIPGMLQSVSTYRDTTGLFRDTKYVFLITAILNIFFSIVLGNIYGLQGILFATAISRLMTNFWFEPLMLFKNVFNRNSRSYFLKQIKFLLYVVIMCLFIKIIPVFNQEISFFSFFLKCLFVTSTNGIVYFLYRNSNEFIFIKTRFVSVLKK